MLGKHLLFKKKILRRNLESEDTNCKEWGGLNSQTECGWRKFCVVCMVFVKRKTFGEVANI